MERVSIIVPAFNQAAFLLQAVESALNQTYQALEVIVVDDGSTDATAEVCRRFDADPRVRVIRQPNQGVGAARNRGARESTGQYLSFLDADDFLHPDKIERQVAVLDRAPALDWIYCDIEEVDEAGVRIADSYSVGSARTELNGDILDSLVIGGYFPPHTVVLRRTVFDEAGGFDPALGGNADLDLWLRLAARGHRVEFLDEKLAFYRIRDDGMSRDRTHMLATRIGALAGLARAYPDRTAAAISRLQEIHEDLHRGNQWLNNALHEAWAERPSEPQVLGALVDALLEGRAHVDGTGRAEVWDVSLAGRFERSIVLHPPARLTWQLPSADGFRLTGAIALHPDVHTHARSGPCRFEVTVDDRLRWICLVDPKARDEDRRWLPFELDVPPRSSGHDIHLETRGIGGDAFRWALWGAVRCVQPTFSIQKLQPKEGCTPW